MLLAGEGLSEGENKEFETDGFGPCNVTFAVPSLPAWDESPSVPPWSNGDANANARTSI